MDQNIPGRTAATFQDLQADLFREGSEAQLFDLCESFVALVRILAVQQVRFAVLTQRARRFRPSLEEFLHQQDLQQLESMAAKQVAKALKLAEGLNETSIIRRLRRTISRRASSDYGSSSRSSSSSSSSTSSSSSSRSASSTPRLLSGSEVAEKFLLHLEVADWCRQVMTLIQPAAQIQDHQFHEKLSPWPRVISTLKDVNHKLLRQRDEFDVSIDGLRWLTEYRELCTTSRAEANDVATRRAVALLEELAVRKLDERIPNYLAEVSWPFTPPKPEPIRTFKVLRGPVVTITNQANFRTSQVRLLRV